MTAATWIVIWGAIGLIAGAFGSLLAAKKNRNRSAWTAWCFLFPPAIVMLWLAPTRVDDGPPKRKSSDDNDDAEDVEDILGDSSD